ncbi:MAG: hypothetical protein RLZZ416_525 [Candidatus Parcubacteria bacterium]|jgi:pseudaminic acid biosynthesis-associated methylase
MKGKNTQQLEYWKGNAGKQYTDRNPQSIDEENEAYQKQYGISRTEMNEQFLAGIDRTARILEVGANIGLQLEILRQSGFSNLLGIEPGAYAVRQSRRIHPEVGILEGSGFDLPFKDGHFDLVYTSGVLIHVAPDDLPDMLREIYRVSRLYIWGFEYYAPQPTQIVSEHYQGNLLWKRDFAARYRELFPDLRLIKEQKYAVRGSPNIDQMFLLAKST